MRDQVSFDSPHRAFQLKIIAMDNPNPNKWLHARQPVVEGEIHIVEGSLLTITHFYH